MSSGSGRSPTLSKRTLYAPLAAAGAAGTNGAPALAVREATLYAFFEKVSADCGRDNNGGRGIRKKMMEQRLSQRSLTLFGGGILPSTNHKQKTKRNSSYHSSGIPQSQSNRSKRLKLSSSVSQKKAPLPQETETNHGTPSSSSHTDTKQNIIGGTPSVVVPKGEELERLNQIWNEYAQRLLRVWAATSTPPSSTNNNNGIELVGARVRILSCPSHRHWNDTEGIVVGQSKHMWTLAVVVDVASKKSPSRTAVVTVVRKVPKQNSRLSIAIPVNKPKSKDEDATDEESSTVYIEIEGPKTR
eukprot:scaffold164943_cov49-Attheya_sp.AAC.2